MKIEMHTHTSQSSPCANVSATESPKLYKDAGYHGIVITDHYSKWVYDQSPANTPEEYVEYFLQGYRTACSAAKAAGINLFLGAEVSLTESPNDYLLYGVSEEFFYQNLSLEQLSLSELYHLCHQNDILLFQAHPYRTYCTPADATYLDGAESFNGNPRHNNQNEKARAWVEINNLIPSSGSDYHEYEDLAKGGIITPRDISNIKELCDCLKNGDYQLIE